MKTTARPTDKKKLPADKALQWALFDELPKGHPIGQTTWDIVVSYSRLGTRVQTGGGGDGMGFLPGEPHPDALAIAAALRALPRCELSRAECESLIGCYAALDPLAIKAIAGAPFDMALLALQAATLKSGAPAWDIGRPRAEVMRHKNGHAIVFGFDEAGALIALRPNAHNDYRATARPRALVVYTEPTIGQLLETRAEYTVWHRAMMTLRRRLAGKLSAHEIVAPLAGAMPWLSDARRAETFKAAPVKMVKLPLKPSRAAASRPHESDIEAAARMARQKGRRKRAGGGAGDGAERPVKYGVFG